MTEEDEKSKYQVCRILYKTDNTAGWYMAEKSGSLEECEKVCEELKQQCRWYDFKCWVDGWYSHDINISLRKCFLEASDLHMRTSLIYNTGDEKYYYPEELMPYPAKCSPRSTSKFSIDVKMEPDNDEDGFLSDLEEEEDFECISAKLYFSNNVGILIEAEQVMKDIPNFLKRLKKEGYSNLSIEEYWYSKFLAWKKGNKIRFVIQSYGNDVVKVILNKFVNEDLFFNEFNKLYEMMKQGFRRVKRLHKQFKQEELFLKSLPWKLDTDTSKILREYIPLDSDCAKSVKFKNFVKKVSEKSVEHTLDFKTWKKDYCMRQEDYYYKVKNNKLIRFLYFDGKNKEILRYLNLYNIHPDQNTNLESLYNDVIKHSGREAITCYLGNNREKPYEKEANIYEDGGIDAPSATAKEIKELQDIINKIVIDKQNNIFAVGDFFRLLQKYGVHASSYCSDRTMCIKG